MALTKTPIELSSTPGIVDNSNATAITIDASENVLVGKTALEYENTAGHIFRNDGLQSSIRSGANVVDFNRLSSDGEIIRISKDGTTVGSIGAGSGSLFIGNTSQSSGISFYGTALYPNSGGSISATNGANDLGAPTARWKDIYLSGGAFLGGTAAANKLEDYEEGTWTPTDASGEGYSLTVNSATYTKIGRLVYITVYIDYPAQSSSAAQLNGGLPFPSMSGTTYPQLTARVIDDTVSAQNLTFQITTNSTEGGVLDGLARITNAELSGKGVLYTGCYQTA